jgi:hypothetical protein
MRPLIRWQQTCPTTRRTETRSLHAEGGGKLGYLSRENVERYRQVFKSLEKRGYNAAACPAMLTGGGLT